MKPLFSFITLYTVGATEYVTAQIDATFHEGRGMENGKLTIMSILQALMRGCLGRDFVGKQSKDAFSCCHKYYVTQPYLVSIIYFIE